jgi:hypothetical protein
VSTATRPRRSRSTDDVMAAMGFLAWEEVPLIIARFASQYVLQKESITLVSHRESLRLAGVSAPLQSRKL